MSRLFSLRLRGLKVSELTRRRVYGVFPAHVGVEDLWFRNILRKTCFPRACGG